MSRQTLALDGAWQFAFAPDVPTIKSADSHLIAQAYHPPQGSTWREINVPAPWAAQMTDLRLSTGTGWYRRKVEIPATWSAGAIILHFGAVNYFCQIWWNDHFIGEHEGGYLPFELDLTKHVSPGEAGELTVRVVMPSNDPDLYPDFPFGEIPHGKQSWYGPLGGIWQSVTLAYRPPAYLTHLQITPRPTNAGDLDQWTVHVQVETSRPIVFGEGFSVEIFGPDGERCAQAHEDSPNLTLTIASPRLWDLDTPHLYTARVAWYPLGTKSNVDVLSETFGFRTFETEDGTFRLNGRLIYLRGALDQDYYPDLIATPPSQEYIEDQFRQAKAMGLNCMRVHIKIPDPRYFAAADKVGILIWAELPNWQQLTDQSARRGRQTLAGMVRRDGNHPSIVIWTIINEDWGTELVSNPDHRRWLAEMVTWLKELDPTRLVVDNSPCFPNHHVGGDVDDFHFYAAMPDSAAQWETWMDDMARRGDFLYAPEHQPNRRAGALPPLVVSEFGNWGLPDLASLLTQSGDEPWWFDTGWERSDGDVYASGVMDRFRSMALGKTFENFAGLAQVAQAAQVEALKYEIESIRERPELAGYVITEWADTHWECNGVLDMARGPKRIATELAEFNGDTLIVPRPDRRAYWAGTEMIVGISLSHYGPNSISDARLEWTLSNHHHEPLRGVFEGIAVAQAQVMGLPSLTVTLPQVDRPVHSQLDLRLVNAAGEIICQNKMVVGLYPVPVVNDQVICREDALAEELTQAGYRVHDDLAGPGVLVMSRLDDVARRHVEKGGRALLLAADEGAISTQLPRFSIKLQRRQGTPWAGDWASSLAWFRKERFATHLPSDRWLDFTCASVIPETVITDVTLPEWEQNVLAGLFVGWLRRPAALVLRFPLGRGELLVTTLHLAGQIALDPVAAFLFQEHLRQQSAVKGI